MAAPSGIPTRSLYGCWTCRVRRKKCDESRPSCSTCNSLELECHGYGPRPEWMDKGVLQKQKALEFKHMVGQNKWKKGRQNFILTSGSRNKGSDLPSASASTQTPANATSIPPLSSVALPLLDQGNFFIGEYNELDRSPLIDPTWGVNIPTSGVSLYSQGNCPPMPQFRHVPGLPTLQESDTLLGNIDIMDLAADDTTLAAFDEAMWYMTQKSPHYFHETATPNDHSTPREHSVDPESYQRPASAPIPLPKTVLEGGKEDTLFMHYLDGVFYTQWPFYNPADKWGRDWIFSIIKQVRPAYYATLALSERDILSSKPHQSRDILLTCMERLRGKDSYYDLALQSLKSFIKDHGTLDKRTRLIHSIEGLTSILQLLFWELFYGGTKNWQALLHSASILIIPLVQARMGDTPSAGPEGQLINTIPLSPDYGRATCVMLGSFISLDIISSASTRSTPFLNINHIHALSPKFGVSLDPLMGCRNSVMCLICEISALDTWKKESQAARKLSVVDLVKRGADIETRLRHELADIASTTNTPLTTGQSPSVHSSMYYLASSLRLEVSKAYALAAIMYLHVVISGPYPELPEIAAPVSEAIALFQTINKKDPRPLRSLVWPFCVAGCLARDEQQSSFRDLVVSATPTTADASEESPSLPIGTYFEAFKIMEQCWETRRTLRIDCDWSSVMVDSGRYVLLR